MNDEKELLWYEKMLALFGLAIAAGIVLYWIYVVLHIIITGGPPVYAQVHV